MKFALTLSLFFTATAFADIAVYGPTNQTITLTGIGPNSAGQGQSRVTWGDCVFDDATTTCTLTAPFKGVGPGGTVKFVLAYPGNGPSPLTTISNTPGGDLVFFNLTSGTFTVTLVESDGTTIPFYQLPNFNFFFTTAATCTGVPQCAVGQVGLTPNSTITGVVTGQVDAAPVIRTSGVITASSYGGYSALAPGTWMEIYGTNLAHVVSQLWSGDDFKGNLAPTKLAGVTVTIAGLPAYVDFVSPGQVNAQVPSGVAPGKQPVIVTNEGGASIASTITVNAVEPGLLAPGVFKLPAGQYVAALFPDGITFVLPPVAGAPTAKAKPGDTIIMYGVGFGPVTPDIPAGQIVDKSNQLAGFKAFFNGTPATVAFAGLTGGFLGLYQFNIVVPNVAASDSVPFTYTLNGVAGPQNLIIPIRN